MMVRLLQWTRCVLRGSGLSRNNNWQNFVERGSWKGKLKGKLWGFNTDLEVKAGHPERAAMQAVLDKELKFCGEDRMLIGFRSGYPKQSTLAYWVVLSQRTLRTACAGRTLWPSPEAGHKPFLCQVPSLYPEEKASLSLKTRDTERSLNKQAFLSVPQFATLTSDPLSYDIPFHNFPLLNKANMKMLRFNHFFGSFPYEGSCVTDNWYYIN